MQRYVHRVGVGGQIRPCPSSRAWAASPGRELRLVVFTCDACTVTEETSVGTRLRAEPGAGAGSAVQRHQGGSSLQKLGLCLQKLQSPCFLKGQLSETRQAAPKGPARDPAGSQESREERGALSCLPREGSAEAAHAGVGR